jgi:hypothetical protein
MNGKRMRLEKVESPVEKKTSEKIQDDEKSAKVISLKDLKKK